jgi:hypothetical protein
VRDLVLVEGRLKAAVFMQAVEAMVVIRAVEVVSAMAGRSFTNGGRAMLLSMYRGKTQFMRSMFCTMIIAIILLLALVSNQSQAAKLKQQTFSTPQEAVNEMIEAMKTGNDRRLLVIFGGADKELFSSGDEIIDRPMGQEFVKAYEEKNTLEPLGKNKMTLHVGKDNWSWPVPIVRAGKRWHFDTKEGSREILARRIGENELAAIQVCLAYVDAQREYAHARRTGGIMEYARSFTSDSGKQDGLCWDEKEIGEQSPLGPMVGNACKAAYAGKNQGAMVQPYHGYFYKILEKQGKNAPGGSYDYVVDGKMIGGFALVAYPARYGSSGITTLIINQDGMVFEKNLGKNTEKIAEAMTGFDPDQTWKQVK